MWKWFKWVLLSIVIIAVILFAIMIIRNMRGFDKPVGDKNTASKVSGNKDCKKNPNPVFSKSFVDIDRIKFLAPIGTINGGSPGRGYVFAKDSTSGATREKIPVYAPTDATLEGIVYARRNQNDSNAPGEYRLDFSASCEVTFHLDHLDEVSAEIKDLAPTEPADNTRNAKKVSKKVTAGELVAYTNGTDQSGGFDFFLINYSKEVAHINQDRWQWDQTKHAFCPYDYFTKDLKDKYYSMFRSHDGQELENPSCGTPSHDVAGTASGGWFQGESTDNEGKWLEIGNQNGKVEVAFRDSGRLDFTIRDYTPEILPEKLTVGNRICYSEEGKWAYVNLETDSKLSVAKGEGSCPASFPSSGAESWER